MRDLRILLHRGVRKLLSKTIFRLIPHKGFSVMEEGWDYLIILDACRYDLFKEVNYLEGNLKKKISKGSFTPEWFKKNFPGKYEDIMYITANGFPRKLSEGNKFFLIDDTGEYAWDEEMHTVLPNDLTKAALKNIKKHPDKRAIIHYSQPHAVFIGEARLEEKPDFYEERPAHAAFDLARMGELNNEKLKDMYLDNLKLVLDEVKKLLKHLEGKIVITSDHGEMLGDGVFMGIEKDYISKSW